MRRTLQVMHDQKPAFVRVALHGRYHWAEAIVDSTMKRMLGRSFRTDHGAYLFSLKRSTLHDRHRLFLALDKAVTMAKKHDESMRIDCFMAKEIKPKVDHGVRHHRLRAHQVALMKAVHTAMGQRLTATEPPSNMEMEMTIGSEWFESLWALSEPLRSMRLRTLRTTGWIPPLETPVYGRTHTGTMWHIGVYPDISKCGQVLVETTTKLPEAEENKVCSKCQEYGRTRTGGSVHVLMHKSDTTARCGIQVKPGPKPTQGERICWSCQGIRHETPWFMRCR